MNIIPGMELVKDGKILKVVAICNRSVCCLYTPDNDCCMVDMADILTYTPTGNVDWSMVPDGTDVEAFIQNKWYPGKKQGSRDEFIFVYFPNEESLDLDSSHVRISQRPIKRKEKFWVNIYLGRDGTYTIVGFQTKQRADDAATTRKVAETEIELEWEDNYSGKIR